MRQVHRLWLVSVVSLVSTAAMAAPPDGQPKLQSGENSGPSDQGQSQNGRSQQQGQDTQSQSVPPPAPPPGYPYPYGPPTIEVNPQIQVQVNPKLDVQANPQSDADANADAKADAQANPKADATADVDTEIKSDVEINGESSEGSNGSAPPAAPPASEPRTVTRVKIVHRPVPSNGPTHKPGPPPRRQGLMVLGAFTFGASYIGTAINGALLNDACHRASNEAACRQISTKMLIPVAGPFMAIEDSEVQQNRIKLAALGGLQAVGATMAVLGAVMHIKDGRRNRILNEHGVRIGEKTRVAPMAGAQGAGLNMNMRF